MDRPLFVTLGKIAFVLALIPKLVYPWRLEHVHCETLLAHRQRQRKFSYAECIVQDQEISLV